MKGSIIVSLLTTISDYINQTVGNFTSFSDFHLKSVGEEKTMLYVIIPVMDTAWEGLTNIFFSQLFDQLYESASNNHAKLKVPVNFILDEFVNLGKFNNYEEFLATCRGYGIGVSTILQSLTQLQDKYNKEKAESILGNCSVQICMNASNHTTAKYFSDLLGKTTVKVETSNKSSSKNTGQKDGGSTSSTENESYSARDLMTADEVKSMSDDTEIIIFANKPPIKAGKAYQFKLFPQPVELLSQTDYANEPNLNQIHKLALEINEYYDNKEKNDEEKQKKKTALDEEKEKVQKEKQIKAENSFMDDFEIEEDSLDEAIDE